MKILFLTPRFPFPPHKGDQAVAYHRLRTLAASHEIVLVTLYQRESELKGLPELRPFCTEIHTVRLPRWRSYLNMAALGPFTRTPLQVLYFRSGALRQKIDELLSSGTFDLVHAFMLRVGPYIEDVELPTILELIDSMRLNIGRTAARARGLRRLVYAEEHRRVSRYERVADQLADRLIFVSDIDRAEVPSDRSITLPLGVEVRERREAAASQAPIVVFSGNMAYAPNVEASTWFATRCWSDVRASVPHAEFWVIGANPAPSVRELAALPGVRVTGFVPDLGAALAQAAVAVAPMQSGSGMQFKVLEAMASGIPVVATHLGVGAIAARPQDGILVANAPAEFASAVVDLIRDPSRREALGTRARAFVAANHSWDRMAAEVDALYRVLGAEGPLRERRRRAAG